MNGHQGLLSALFWVFAVSAGVTLALAVVTSILAVRNRRRRQHKSLDDGILTMGDLVMDDGLTARFRSTVEDRRERVWYLRARAEAQHERLRQLAAEEAELRRPDHENGG